MAQRQSSRLARILGGPGFAFLLLLLSVLVSPAAELHVVRPGETLTGIAQAHGLSVAALAEHNGIPSDTRVIIGQQLKIPEGSRARGAAYGGTTYVVRRYDTLTGIARRYGLSVASLARLNGLSSTARVKVGQRLRLPGAGGAVSAASAAASLPAAARSAIREAPVQRGRWKYIVIHHSATTEGSMQGMDAYHRKTRHMENGLAYHFVIGNGHGMAEGSIGVGNRWTRQLQGGHLASESLNEVAIGICLVGNFDQTSPTAKQMQSLAALVDALRERCGLPRSSVRTHQQINPVHTRCPGRHLAASPRLKEIQGKSK